MNCHSPAPPAGLNMKRDISSLTSAETSNAAGSSALRHFLFTDDYDFRRGLVRFLNSKPAVQRFVTFGLAFVGLGLLALVVTVLAPERGWRLRTDASPVKRSDVRVAGALDDSGAANVLDIQTASRPTSTASDDRSYTLAMVDPAAGSDSAANRSDPGKSAMGGTAGGSSVSQFAHSLFGGGGGGVGGGSGGSGGGISVATVSNGSGTTNSKVATVPDGGHSLALLLLGLTVAVAGRIWLNRSQSRIRG